MTSPKVLHLYSSVNAGGGMLFVQALVEAMQADGMLPHVALRPEAELLNRLSSVDIDSEQSDNRLADAQIHRLPLKNGLDVYSIWQLSKIVKRDKIAIIHAHTGRDYSLAFLVAKITGCQCIFHRHYFRVSSNPVTRFLFRHSDFVISVNQQLKMDYVKKVGIDLEKITTLPNWYELPSEFTQAKQEPKQSINDGSDTFIISMAGNINSNKAQHRFIAAAKKVLASKPNCLFQIIGVTESNSCSEYFKELLLSVEVDNLQDKIVFLPWQNSIDQHYEDSDVWVVPSRNEAFGRVAIEAMYHQVPVVASKVGGLQEIVEHDVTGLLFDHKDAKALAENVLFLLENADQRQRLASNALAHVKTNFSKRAVLDRLYAIYQTVLN